MIFPSNKILTLQNLNTWRENQRKNGKKVVFSNGCFDFLHHGHVDYLFKARMKGDALIVLLNSDASVRTLKGPTRPINAEQDRAFVLAGLACVDAVLIFDTPRCTEWIEKVAPDIYVKGADYTIETLDKDERTALEKVNAKIEFIPFVEGFSTTEAILKSANAITKETNITQ